MRIEGGIYQNLMARQIEGLDATPSATPSAMPSASVTDLQKLEEGRESARGDGKETRARE